VPAFPRQRDPLDCDVAVIGGGLTGCLAAYTFAAAGAKVVVLEENRIGRGATASALGLISEEPGVPFPDVERALGLRLARHAFAAWRRAALDFSALLRRLDIKCQLEPREAMTIAATPEQSLRLKRELKARRDAGLDAPMLTARAMQASLGVNSDAAMREKGTAVLDPFRACLGIAQAAVDRGAQIFERTPVRRTKFTRKTSTVVTSAGDIRTRAIIVATGAPTDLFGSLARHFWYRTDYLVLTERIPLKTRRLLGQRTAVFRDMAQPAHIVRWLDDEQLLVSGASQESPAPRQRDRTIVQRTGQLMYELSTMYPDISGIQPAFGWDAAYARSADGLPCLGPHRNFPFHLFAFGDSSRSLTGAYLASRVLLRFYLDEVESADAPFAFTRHGR
jgi:glycine/D-amino acid oxidase-like deaminating enzyme